MSFGVAAVRKARMARPLLQLTQILRAAILAVGLLQVAGFASAPHVGSWLQGHPPDIAQLQDARPAMAAILVAKLTAAAPTPSGGDATPPGVSRDATAPAAPVALAHRQPFAPARVLSEQDRADHPRVRGPPVL